jgi:hypothetical protein
VPYAFSAKQSNHPLVGGDGGVVIDIRLESDDNTMFDYTTLGCGNEHEAMNCFSTQLVCV